MKSYEVSEHAIKRLRQRVDGFKHASPRKVKASIRRMLNSDTLVKKVKRGPATVLIGEKLCGICIDNVLVTVFRPDAEELAKRGIILEEKEGEAKDENQRERFAQLRSGDVQTPETCVDHGIY